MSGDGMIYEKMDPYFKAKWVAALRSGEYQQGRTRLHTASGKLCCIGVACEIAELPKKLTDDHTIGNCYIYSDRDGDNPRCGVLPLSFRKSIGVTFECEDKLLELNDSLEWDFNQIADWIEEHL